MRMRSIASGSSGNCIYIGSDNTHILVDDGISRKRVENGLNSIDISISDLSAIFVTHEHSDHIDGLGVLLKKNPIPVYASRGTIDGMVSYAKMKDVDPALFHVIDENQDIMIQDLKVHSMHIYHDANQPLAYTFEDSHNKKMGVITDLGHYDDYIVNQLKGMNSLLIEANYDIRMLEAGKYPYYLKRRILGDHGHLSNEASGRLLNELLNDGMEHVLLGHLSHENNYADLAFETVRMEINLGENEYKAEDFDIRVADRQEPSHLIEL
ncbi:MAG: MBL fold metallo-hydrolase [Lachnospiraceae bacterium]